MMVSRARVGSVACAAVAVGLLARGYQLPDSKVRLRGVFWVMNWICDVAGRMQALDVGRLSALHEEVLAAERRAFDDSAASEDAKRRLFAIQVAGVDAEGNRFTPLGRALFRDDLERRLRRRLRLADALASADAPGRRAVVAPVVIVGLPRTGSTLLHRLLAVDPASRSPRYWELSHDAEDVSPATDPDADDARAEAVEAGFRKLSLLSPNGLEEFFKFHKVDARAIEEVTPMLRRYFFDMETALLAPDAVAARDAWLRSGGVDRTFLVDHLRRWLEVQRGPEAACWLLKSPALTALLPEVLRVFPDAVVVFTSRDPKRVAPSLCGLNEVAGSVKYRGGRGGRARIGDAVLGRLAAYADGQRAFVAENPGRALLLDYADLVRDPVGAVRRVYEHAGKHLAPHVERAMERHVAENRQHAHGKPAYAPEQYALDDADIDRRFADYAPFHTPAA